MGYTGSNKGGDDSEILGKISKISTSPSGGKRLEVEGTFQNKMEMDQPHLPFYMKQPQMPGHHGPQKIRIDISHEEARKFSEEDEIRARIRQKYSESGRSGGCGMGGAGDLYNYVGESSGSSGSSKSKGMSSSKWNRFSS